MRRSLPYLVTVLLSVGITLLVVHWMDRGSQGSRPAVRYAPDMVVAAERGKEAVVFISTQLKPVGGEDATENEDKSGSGVLIAQDGYIVTNYHVVSNAEMVYVKLFNHHEFLADVIGADSAYDVALLKINGTHLPFLQFGNSDSVMVGESVIAIGNPYKLDFTVTGGIVSAVGRDLKAPGNDTRNFIQTDVPINTGNSGGPLLNARGQLIGIMAILVTVSGQYEGYSFAMPSNLVRKITGDLRQYGKRQRVSVGIRIRPVTHEIASYAKMSEITGAVVDALTDGGAADIAGVRSLDIILSADGRVVESPSAFLAMLPLYSPGDTLHLVVNRDGTEIPIDVLLREPED